MLPTRLNPWQLSSRDSIDEAARLQALAAFSISLSCARSPADAIAMATSIVGRILPNEWIPAISQTELYTDSRSFAALEPADHYFLTAAIELLRGRLAVLELEARLDECARDLHDTAVQDLLALSFHLRDLAIHPEEISPDQLNTCRMDALRMASKLRSQISCLCEKTHIAYDKTGVPGDCIDFPPNPSGVPDIELSIQPDFPALPGTTASILGFIALEAARNALRHAGARRIQIDFAVSGAQVHLTVADDGKGIVLPLDLTALRSKGHFGLAGMVERTHSAGGELEIRSGNPGTVVQARIPIPSKG